MCYVCFLIITSQTKFKKQDFGSFFLNFCKKPVYIETAPYSLFRVKTDLSSMTLTKTTAFHSFIHRCASGWKSWGAYSPRLCNPWNQGCTMLSCTVRKHEYFFVRNWQIVSDHSWLFRNLWKIDKSYWRAKNTFYIKRSGWWYKRVWVFIVNQ